MDIPKTYQPNGVEDSIYQRWKESGFFNPDNLPGKRRKSFTISMPPPNATGTLHVGHAVMLALQDIVIRYQRMRGKKTLWLPGTDHAAIATQAKVERLLYEQTGKTRHDVGREKFLASVNEFVADSQSTIRNQIAKMGSSCDWSRERFTLDATLSVAVREAFVRMYDDGLIYRGSRIVNWCSHCGSTLSDDEVEYRQERAPFYYFRYGPVVIGTARPETKFGDKVIVVHPSDKRYIDMVGKEFAVEWILGPIKARVIADAAADPELGSGAMTITPGHSFADFELAQKYNIAIEKIIDEQGKLTDYAGEFAGLPVAEARKKVVEVLQRKGLVERIDENYEHNLSVCYRCGTPVEPLPSRQWFINVNKKTKRLGGKTIREKALEVVKRGEIEIIPERFAKTYFHWIENLRDWCISRQIWYGHQIPAWYRVKLVMAEEKMGFHKNVVPQVLAGKTKTYRLRDHGYKRGDVIIFENSQTGEVFGSGKIVSVQSIAVGQIQLDDVAHGETYQTVEQLINAFTRHYPKGEITAETTVFIYEYAFTPIETEVSVGAKPPKGEGWQQDPDTLDTWFSSGLWTFSTLGWPGKTKDFKTFHPTSLMETGYDILFFWVARMIIMSTYHVGEVPFKQVYLHGLVRDEQGRKMSKSLGNVIDPLDTIAKFGADATRLSLVIGTTPGNDTNLSEAKIAGYRNFVNKLWNIARYVLVTVAQPRLVERRPKPQSLADRWILAELDALVTETTRHLDQYNFSLAGEGVYAFTWSKFADWYLEIAKIESGKDEILLYVLQILLKLWHPFTPFVTEHLWAMSTGGTDTLLLAQDWPKPLRKLDARAVEQFAVVRDVIAAVRSLRQENGIAPGEKLPAVFLSSQVKLSLLEKEQVIITALARLEKLTFTAVQTSKPSLSAVVAGVEIYLPVSGTIDTAQAVARLAKELQQTQAYIASQSKKLENTSFVDNAPHDIVAAEKNKLRLAEEKAEKISRQIAGLR